MFKVLREMAKEHEGVSEFDLADFEKRIENENLDGKQRAMLAMRLEILKSFLPPPLTLTTKPKHGRKNNRGNELNCTSCQSK